MSTIWLPPGVREGALQSNPSAWATQRRGLVTASRFADVMTEPRTPPRSFVDAWVHLIPESERTKVLKTGPRAGQIVEADGLAARVVEAAAHQGAFCWGDTARSYMMELLASAITGEERVGGKSAAMERGNDKEADALDRYQADRFADVLNGRLLTFDGTRIGATPDGFIEEDTQGEGPGIIEVKCPESKRHMQTWLERELPTEYVEQVQGQLWLTGRQWCDFVSFDDRFPHPMQIVVIRVKRDEDLIARMAARVHAFAAELTERESRVRSYLDECMPEQAEVVHRALQEAAEDPTFAPEA